LSVSLVLLVTLTGIGLGHITFEDVEIKNQSPVSNAGSDQIVSENKTIILDGTGSRDVDGNVITYHWKQISGIPVDMTDDTSDISTFTAPDVGNTTILKFKLSVNDAKNASSSDLVNVIVSNETVKTYSEPNNLLCNILQVRSMPVSENIGNTSLDDDDLLNDLIKEICGDIQVSSNAAPDIALSS